MSVTPRLIRMTVRTQRLEVFRGVVGMVLVNVVYMQL